MSGRRADVPPAPRDVAARAVASIVIDDDGCWITKYAVTRKGYAKVGWSRDGKKRTSLAHIVVWEYLRAPVPSGLEIDHLCRNRACVNPDHLEVVTAKVNVHRSDNPAAHNAVKTECPAGHPYSDENTYVARSGRMCKTCMRDRLRARRERASKGLFA